MRVEKIELTGFKSFAEKTIFTLHPGMTCIVGPNGCGKSNIVDAFRWVLGEQSAKSLRGEKMEEVIFNGSQTKKPRGMAEITLFVSGLYPDGQGNGNGSERLVTVTRRLYRSGESEYLINKHVCRLKDIREMFLDTGLEMKSYSVLEQGRIGEIINARPVDRRFLIEEVAGVMKYKVRKAEARSKLESSRQNLQRVIDIISEVKRHLNSLDRQAKKAEKYKRLIDALREVELRTSKRDYSRMDQSLQEVSGALDMLKTEEVRKRAVMAQLESSLQQKRILMVEKEKEVDAINTDLQTIEKTIAEMERTIAVHRTEIEHLGNYVITLQGRIEETRNLLEEKRLRAGEISGKDAHIQARLDSLKETLSQRKEELSEAEEGIFALEEDIDDKRRDLFRFTDSLGLLRNELNRLETTHEAQSRRASTSEREAEETERRVSELKAEIERVDGDIGQRNAALGQWRDKRDRYLKEIAGLKEGVEGLRQKRSELREEVASLRSRIQSLQEMVTGNLDREMIQKAGISLLASLSEVVEVEPRYEKAVEAALSEKIKGFIVSTTEDIRKSVELVNRGNLPRTAFLSWQMSNEKQQAIKSTRRMKNGEAAPVLDSVVRSEDKYTPLVKSLLDDYLLTEDMDSAIALLKAEEEMPLHVRVVTLNGEVLEPGGAVLCGSGSGILRLRRDLRELEASVQKHSDVIAEVEVSISETDQRIEELKSLLREVDSEIVSHEKELSLLQASERRFAEDRERLEKKLGFIRLDIQELHKELNGLEEDISRKKEEVASEEEHKRTIESGLGLLQEELSVRRSGIDAKRHLLTDLKVEINGYTERLSSITREREALQREVGGLQKKEISLEEEIRNNDRIVQQKRDSSAGLEERLKEAVSGAGTLRQRLSEKRDAIRDERESVVADDEALKRERQEVERLSNEVHEKEVLKAELLLKISNLVDGISEKYQVDLAGTDISTSEAEEEDHQKVLELREKIQTMGHVNLGSLDEYRELKERHEFLTGQHEDIVQSIAELQEAITRINRTTRKRLKEAFDLLNRKFGEVFKLLFGGGSAELRLTDEADILESGINIIVQPPGKKLQNLNLLSGGEKALSALSLLFAGFLLKPTPLCILDEADAPLDETNTERFKAMIKDLSVNIQFIVITHNRVTMEAADYLYGITMEEPGISKVLSMEFV
ncbi:MAG TPA: chromosome segregation protein SMC [Nitrospirae bacterium]|nr:chromosome segregation protein SMC [Nitrospirota bacterium]